MPKSRANRLLQLVCLLGGRRPRSMAELVERFGVSDRTLYRDLDDLGRCNIPVTRIDGGYRLVEGATLRPLRLTAEEHAVLRLALESPVLRGSPELADRLATLEAKLDAITSQAEETSAALALASVDRSGETTHEVVLRFDAALAPLIENARHHPSEEVREAADGELEYRVRVSHLDEIARWILGFGGRCRVLEPTALRERVVGLADGVNRANESHDEQPGS